MKKRELVPLAVNLRPLSITRLVRRAAPEGAALRFRGVMPHFRSSRSAERGRWGSQTFVSRCRLLTGSDPVYVYAAGGYCSHASGTRGLAMRMKTVGPGAFGLARSGIAASFGRRFPFLRLHGARRRRRCCPSARCRRGCAVRRRGRRSGGGPTRVRSIGTCRRASRASTARRVILRRWVTPRRANMQRIKRITRGRASSRRSEWMTPSRRSITSARSFSTRTVARRIVQTLIG